MKKINWGIIGLGSIANKFADAFSYIDNATVKGIASFDQNKLHLGNNLKKTCCSSTLIPLENNKYIKPDSHRFGDVVLDSKSGEFTYSYPVFLEPSSDHRPISAKLLI